MSDSGNIFGHEREGIPEDKLQAYLEGRLSPEEQHDVERWLADEGIESEALEGLLQLGAEETRQSVSSLNHQLQKQLRERRRKPQRFYRNNSWALVAIIVVLLLCALAYLVLRLSV